MRLKKPESLLNKQMKKITSLIFNDIIKYEQDGKVIRFLRPAMLFATAMACMFHSNAIKLNTNIVSCYALVQYYCSFRLGRNVVFLICEPYSFHVYTSLYYANTGT